MSDFESDSDTDFELGPGQQEVLSTLLWIQEGDIVRFSPADNSNVFNGLVDGITRDQDAVFHLYYQGEKFKKTVLMAK